MELGPGLSIPVCLVKIIVTCDVTMAGNDVTVSVINQVPIIVYLGSDKAEIDHFT